jgi:transposase
VGCDETSAKRGQDYVSLFMDLAARRVMFATPGRDAQTVGAFAEDLTAHKGEPQTQIQRVCCDMSPAFIKGITDHLAEHEEEPAPDGATETPQNGAVALAGTMAHAAHPDGETSDEAGDAVTLHRPQIIFDRYHVVAKANEAVDEVRRTESKIRPELKRSRYVWLKNESNLTAKQRETLAWLTRPSMRLATTRAARWRDDFNEFYAKTDAEEAEAYLTRWCYGKPAWVWWRLAGFVFHATSG